MRKLYLFATASALSVALANANPILINFETVPVIATGPSLFASAGPAQTIVVPGVATFTGGVVLGNATNLPAQAFGTPPNTYGTASPSFIPGADPSLQSTLTMTVNPVFGNVDEVSFPIFNGYTAPVTYVVTAYDGVTQVGQQTFTNVPANSNSGYAIADITAPTITSVTIASGPTANGWDFFIDSVALDESVQQAFNGAPEPASFTLMSLALVASGGLLRFKRKS